MSLFISLPCCALNSPISRAAKVDLPNPRAPYCSDVYLTALGKSAFYCAIKGDVDLSIYTLTSVAVAIKTPAACAQVPDEYPVLSA